MEVGWYKKFWLILFFTVKELRKIKRNFFHIFLHYIRITWESKPKNLVKMAFQCPIKSMPDNAFQCPITLASHVADDEEVHGVQLVELRLSALFVLIVRVRVGHRIWAFGTGHPHFPLLEHKACRLVGREHPLLLGIRQKRNKRRQKQQQMRQHCGRTNVKS